MFNCSLNKFDRTNVARRKEVGFSLPMESGKVFNRQVPNSAVRGNLALTIFILYPQPKTFNMYLTIMMKSK